MENIYKIESLKDLETYLSKQDKLEIREKLFSEFLKYADYKNAAEWNKAARLCECLAITGWGEYEPVQAVCGKYFNGNPLTAFYNKFDQPRFVDAVWSKRKNGYTMENGRTSYFESPHIPEKATVLSDYPVNEDIRDIKLLNQRNWIPRCPVYISRTISNCYESSKAVIESIEKELLANLNKGMMPEKYGNAVDYIGFDLSFSYEPCIINGTFCNVRCNYIIAKEQLKLSTEKAAALLQQMYSKKDIEENGYYLRNRYEYGNFRNGKISVVIHFEKELGDLDCTAQKQKIAFHIEEALSVVIEKLKKKKLNYNFDLMQADFLKIMNEWKKYEK